MIDNRRVTFVYNYWDHDHKRPLLRRRLGFFGRLGFVVWVCVALAMCGHARNAQAQQAPSQLPTPVNKPPLPPQLPPPNVLLPVPMPQHNGYTVCRVMGNLAATGTIVCVQH